MNKVDINVQFFRDTLMFRKLFAIIYRDRMGSDRKRLQELDHSIRYGLSSLALNLSQQSQARFPLRQGDNGMTMSFPNNCIHLPITQALACIYNSRPLIDAHPVSELSTPVIASIALPALFPWSGSSTGIVGGDGDLRQNVCP